MFSYYSILAILLPLSFAYNAYATSGVGIITTVAGTGNWGFSGDNGPATSADLNNPGRVHVDAAGNIYIVDEYNHRVRKVDVNGVITTIAGNGNQGYNGDNQPATSASLSVIGIAGVTSDTFGNIYIADGGNYRVRKVDVNGMITTVAGTGNFGYNGDNIAATTADLAPRSISLDKAGNLFISDYSRVRKVDVNGIITTVAGTGNSDYNGDNILATSANLYSPIAAISDFSGNIYIADSGNYRVRKVDVNGVITTVAGTGNFGYNGDGGAAINADISSYGMDIDVSGNIFIADSNSNRIRKVDVNGIITTVAGSGHMYNHYGYGGYNGDNIAATDADLNRPKWSTTDNLGNIYIADTYNNRIRKVTFSAPPTVMPTFMTTSRSTSAKPTKATSTKTPSFKPTNKPTKKKTAAPSRRPTKKPTKKPTK